MARTSDTSRPNAVFILADDLGYADLGCYGGRGETSPCIDRMAQQGLRFTNGYANSAVCSPTRFALATGRWQYRLRGAAEEPLTGRFRNDKVVGLPPEHPTIASLLRESGYRTALVGKWHLGYPPHFGPLKSGYDMFFGPLSGGIDYFTHRDRAGKPDLFEGENPVQEPGYITDVFTSRATDWIEQQARSSVPFFLSLHYTAPHWPWETRDDEHLAAGLDGAIIHLDGGSVGVYQRMIKHMDEGIGAVLDTLDRLGIGSNTLVIFTSDNGGERFSDNWPLVGGKMDLTEGGIRVPYVVRWPDGVHTAGATARQQAITMDWTATILDSANVGQHADYPMDGISLLSVLRDPSHTIERDLFWRMKHRAQRALRSGKWKYLKVDQFEYLFDISADERERANLSRRHPDLLADLRKRWDDWNAAMPPVPEDAHVENVYGEQDMPAR